MLNLEPTIGLPVMLHDNFHLEFGEGVDVKKTSERTFGDLVPVLKDGAKLSDEEKQKTAYLMYRGVCRASDREKIELKNLRFDLTVIMPGMIGEEYMKTFGHYHPKKQGTAVEYSEYYFVANGKAKYLMQKDEEAPSDIIVSDVSAGEGIIMPPGYGHITINDTDKPIVMANWIANDFASDYSQYEQNHGGAFYRIESAGRPNWMANGENSGQEEPREVRALAVIVNPMDDQPVYTAIDKIDLDFLVNPENHLEELAKEKLFTSFP